MKEFDEILKKETIYLKNIRTAFQYEIKNPTKIITIFGEGHDEIVDCNGFSISVADYIKLTLKLGKKVKIFLEYDSNLNYKSAMENIQSFNLQEIIKTLDSMKEIDKIIPVDCRNYYLKPHFHRNLYYGAPASLEYDYINHNYFEPFFRINFSKHPNVTKEGDKILQEYIKNLYTEFTNLKDNWNNIVSPPEYKSKIPYKLEILRFLWSKVVDFYILQELFIDNDTYEYICLIGDNHRRNIQHYISAMQKKKSYHQEVAGLNCVSINKFAYGLVPNYLLVKKFENMKKI